MAVPKLQLVFDPAADALLEDNPMALLIGMLLDQSNSNVDPFRVAPAALFTVELPPDPPMK